MIRSFLVSDLYFVEECLDIGGQLVHSDWLKGLKIPTILPTTTTENADNPTTTAESTDNATSTIENTDIVIHCCHFIIPQHSIVDGQLLKIPATLSAATSN